MMPAEAELARLDAIDARHPDAQNNALSEINEMAERARIGLAIAEGDLDGAAARLAVLIPQCEAAATSAWWRICWSRARRWTRAVAGRSRPRKLLEALSRGHRLGLLRSLLDADPSARKMIRELAQTETLDPVLAFYAERLESSHARPLSPDAAAPANARALAATGEIEAFSEREIEVLRLLAQAMPNKKIARALNLSPETVKWYLSRIYGKLRVAGRDEAVARVRDLGLGG